MLLTSNYVLCVLACAASLSHGLAIERAIHSQDDDSLSARTGGGFAKGLWLRIMPLGASITYGLKSSDGNGYRKALRDQIVAYGNDVNMVGSRRNGSMEDNDVEGWPGYVIDQVQAKANVAVSKYKPNLILLNAGTNDCSGNVDTANAGKRMSNLLDNLYTNAPRVTVVLSTLLARSDVAMQKCVVDLNNQFKSVAATQKSQGRRLVIVDMQPPAGPAVNQLVDGTHPNDAGYAKMATVWFNGIKEADKAGFLQPKEAIAGNPDGVPDRGVYG